MMNKQQMIKNQAQINKIGKVSKATFGTLPGPRPEGMRPFKWIHES